MASYWSRARRRKDSEWIRSELIQEGGTQTLKKTLTVKDLVAFGVACTVGAGIFVTSGSATKEMTGPSLCLSFVVGGVACLMNALCYCEFASRIPAAGSAYSYAYNAMGEFAAFLMGMILFLEYGVSGAVTARGCGAYLAAFLAEVGMPLPAWIVEYKLAADNPAAGVFGFSLLAPLLILVCVLITLRGGEESTTLSFFITCLNVGLIIVFVLVGCMYVEPANFVPFTLPEKGFFGTFEAAGVLFFCFIGFDSVSTLSEEVQNPQKDLPRGILGTLLVCTVMYCSAAIVLVGMVPAALMDTSAPLAQAFLFKGNVWMFRLVSLGAVTTTFVSTLGCITGQLRVFYRMAADGLWPKMFADINPRTNVLQKNCLATGFAMAFASGMLNFDFLVSLISAGTLLSYALVCAGVLLIRYTDRPQKSLAQHLAFEASMTNTPTMPPRIPHSASAPAALHEPLLPAEQQQPEIRCKTLREKVDKLPGRTIVKVAVWGFFVTVTVLGFAITYQWPIEATGAIAGLAGLFALLVLVLDNRVTRFHAHIQKAPETASTVASQGQVLAEQSQIAAGNADEKQTAPAKSMHFDCPWVPFVPLFGILINCYLLASLKWATFQNTLLFLSLGAVFYFYYGVRNSTLNRSRPAQTA